MCYAQQETECCGHCEHWGKHQAYAEIPDIGYTGKVFQCLTMYAECEGLEGRPYVFTEGEYWCPGFCQSEDSQKNWGVLQKRMTPIPKGLSASIRITH